MSTESSGKGPAPGNRILRTVSQMTMERLEPHLTKTELAHHAVLYRADARIRRIHFIDRGLASLVQTMRDGRVVEVGTIGIDGVMGVHAAFGIYDALLDAMVQIPGQARSIAPDILMKESARCSDLSLLLRGCIHLRTAQIAQTAACNRLHDLDQRCCRWLLIAHDNAGSDSFPLTHEFLAMMLGVRRPGVSIAMKGLQESGYVRYARGHVTVVDRGGLERASCECYATIRSRTDALFRAAARARP